MACIHINLGGGGVFNLALHAVINMINFNHLSFNSVDYDEQLKLALALSSADAEISRQLQDREDEDVQQAIRLSLLGLRQSEDMLGQVRYMQKKLTLY